MNALLIALLAALAFIVAYHSYGRWLSTRLFDLKDDAPCPSTTLRDDKDYCPTPKAIVFGHHFTSIAGTGPIVGPAIAILWGWVPALLWVVFGSIFIGAVHDLGSLVVSLRNKGQTVGDIAGKLLNKRVRLLFLTILFLALTIVLAIFGLVIAAVFRQYPSAITPCLLQIPLAVLIGLFIHKRAGKLLLPSLCALGLMYASVIFAEAPLFGALNSFFASLPIATWVALLLGYSYVASVLPVWVLLQPRDYINSLQLLSALGLVVCGLVVAAFFGGAPLSADAARPTLDIVAPALNLHPVGAPPLFPFLFITIACGAVSGFHSLVSSGTTSKQLRSEGDAQFIGYGSMLTEGFLATVVILACGAGLGLGIYATGHTEALTGTAAWDARYASWSSAGGLANMVGAFVDGSANFLKALGISHTVSIALMGVLVASFAATTLDTACRLQRYVVQELAAALLESTPRMTHPLIAPLRGKHTATLFACALAMLIAMLPPDASPFSWGSAGKGGLLLWPLFGATNQLLGGLAFLVITFYLLRRGKAVWMVLVPAVFMLAMPLWAMVVQVFIGTAQQPSWLAQGNGLLAGIGIASIVLELWMLAEAVFLWQKNR